MDYGVLHTSTQSDDCSATWSYYVTDATAYSLELVMIDESTVKFPDSD